MPEVCDPLADERLLAWIRLIASSALLIRLVTDTGPGHSNTVQLLSAGYAVYSVLIVLASHWQPDGLLRRVTALHATDFAWTTVASTVSGGTGSHAFIYFAFVLAAAAFRWDLRRTLFNGLLVLGVGTLQSAAAAAGLTPWAFEFDVYLLRVSYIGCGMAVLFGILADRLHRTRLQATAIAALVSSISRATRMREALSAALTSIAELMHASRVIIAAQDTYTGTVMVWQAVAHGRQVTTSRQDLPAAHATEWLKINGERLWPAEIRRRTPDAAPVVATALPMREAGRTGWLPLAPGLLGAGEWQALLALPFSASGAWNGQIFVTDPRASPRGELRLRFLADIVRQITPGLHNIYLVRRLRSRAEWIERSRISRELHDTANQSIAAIVMRLELLQRHTSPATPEIARELAEIGELIHGLTLDIREFVARRHHDIDAERLPGTLADIVERFSRDTDIEARLDWAVRRLDLPPHHCSQVARIVQEALFNVRRHSHATAATVRVESDAEGWTLLVEDNGKGLGFTGRIGAEHPEFHRRAPRVIRERALALGGSLALESSDSGTCLEITFPPTEHR